MALAARDVEAPLAQAGDNVGPVDLADVGVVDLNARFKYEPPYRKPYPYRIGVIRKYLFRIYVFAVFALTVLALVVDFFAVGDDKASFGKFCKTVSVPLVCMLFTWFHVWLALQMMFYPINFIGCCKPYLGWQGIVPRKAGVMAQRACETMIGNIVTIEEFMERIDGNEFFDELQQTMIEVVGEVLQRLVAKRWPTVWPNLPKTVQAEIKDKVLQDTKKSFAPAILELRANINNILDIKQMSIDALVADPRMMVDMFREIAPRELSFITHVAAVMGFLLGLVQTALYLLLPGKYIDYYMLPISGLIIGFFTNWLAIFMTFRPVWPHMLCGNYINYQGVFLKRQKEAAAKMSQLICAKVIDARAMFSYMVKTSDSGLDQILEIFQRNISSSVDESVGFAQTMVPSFVGRQIDEVKKDVVDIALEILPNHMTEIEAYVDKKMNVEGTLSYRLARLEPPEFENIVHPIFKDDEWILLLVGAVLGVIIGVLQAFAMQYIPN